MADELARRGALLESSATPCSLSPLISRIRSSLFLDWRRTVSSKFFDTQVPSISTEELVLPHHARCVLSRLRCNGHSLLLVQLRTVCAAHSLATLCLSTTSDPDPEELPGFWGSMVFRHDPIPRKRSGNQQQTWEKLRKIDFLLFFLQGMTYRSVEHFNSFSYGKKDIIGCKKN